ncbi:hypothetical protein ISF6_4424 [Piscinibacter sakaiensis]|uniref:Uncharacterized protein n=1 Tax=Piscinibacter sakaiensis TaxID=1547922 RepID=A0A0K8P7Q6_PISS1|nr:hypothetical protein ISF6_4424 [Piscinibacter sakaiensis]
MTRAADGRRRPVFGPLIAASAAGRALKILRNAPMGVLLREGPQRLDRRSTDGRRRR